MTSPIEQFGAFKLSLATPVMWAIIAYYLVPRVFGGQSKNVQRALMVGIPLVLWFSTYRTMKGVEAQTAKNKAAAIKKMRDAEAIMARGPNTPGYAAAAKIVSTGVTY